ncbi:TPA: hypothetical protein DEP90_03080 [Patescibacteria group bacterium]|nr:hypothetical protein [Patescibacteria group bacterium]
MNIGKKIMRDIRRIFSSLLVPIIPPIIAARAIRGTEFISTDTEVSTLESLKSRYIQSAIRNPKRFPIIHPGIISVIV